MKILSITPFLRGAPIHPFSGGKSAASLKITNALIEDGHDVYVLPWSKEYIWNETQFRISNDASYATALPTLFIPRLTDLTKNLILSFSNKKSWKNPKKHIWKYVRDSLYDKDVFLKEAVENVNPVITHIHYTHSDAIDYYKKLNNNIPVILTHHSRGLFQKIPLYDYVIFISKFQFDKAIEQFPEVENKSCYIHNSVSKNYFINTDPRETNNILFLSRFKRPKGFQHLLDAFLADTNLNKYNLFAIGEGEMEAHYRRFVFNHNLDNITFLGRLSERQNAEVMKKNSLFVVPSYGEGFGLVYAEALCMGLPIIGFPDTIKELNELLNLEVGYEFDANNESPEKLAKLIDRAMNSKLTDIKYRKKLMNKARNFFSFDTFKKKYLDIYQKMARN